MSNIETSVSDSLRPCSRIPDDILCEIFLRCLSWPRSTITLSPEEAPLLLTHVCRRWREVAVNYANLWQWLGLDLQNSPVKISENANELVKLLQRSKTASLNLQIRWPTQCEARDHLHLALVPPIRTSLTRLTLQSITFVQLALLPPGLFPRLEVLAISIHGRWEDARHYSYEAFKHAPCLRRVALNEWFYNPSDFGIKISLPWEQLTHFVQASCASDEETAVYAFHNYYLPRCSNLQYLRLTLGYPITAPYQGYSVPTLQGLCLNFWGPEPGTIYLPALLGKIAFSNIKSLRLEGECIDVPRYEVATFCTKLSSFNYLTHLSLSWIHMDYGILRDLVRSTPNVETLDVHIGGELGTHVVFQDLEWIISDPETHVLPRLHTFILRPIDDFDQDNLVSGLIDRDLFRSFVGSRMGASSSGRRIQKIVLFSIGVPAYSEARTAVQDYLDEGLVLEDRVYEKGKEMGEWMNDDPTLQDWRELQSGPFYSY
ncbi:hypothetical protein EST38_g3349 [Candolleomyces aberdarensis]|uniref:Uncharacterized protein n=1 Tax=Candolleomyces aberdarensis TaxID=2316362 RepID=A0A4Q2DTC4_9AGAR|nr:hypothetical protein EST38_g3349 [Candolleomyces aberdarensis]